MEDPEDVAFAKEVSLIINKILAVCSGHDAACVSAALSGLIGIGAAHSGEPDMDDLMRLVKETVLASYDDERAAIRREMN
jgi:hypothetical protein